MVGAGRTGIEYSGCLSLPHGHCSEKPPSSPFRSRSSPHRRTSRSERAFSKMQWRARQEGSPYAGSGARLPAGLTLTRRGLISTIIIFIIAYWRLGDELLHVGTRRARPTPRVREGSRTTHPESIGTRALRVPTARWRQLCSGLEDHHAAVVSPWCETTPHVRARDRTMLDGPGAWLERHSDIPCSQIATHPRRVHHQKTPSRLVLWSSKELRIWKLFSSAPHLLPPPHPYSNVRKNAAIRIRESPPFPKAERAFLFHARVRRERPPRMLPCPHMKGASALSVTKPAFAD